MALQGDLRGVDKNFSPKDAFYLDNSNATSFSSIGHRGGKLFNFFTFLDIWGVKMPPPRGGLREVSEKVFFV